MARELTERFMRTLQQFEQTGEVEPLVALFSETAELDNVMRSDCHHGQEGARQFWHTYLSAFNQIHSQFTHVTENADTAVMEWTAHGTLSNGRPLTYRGVSVVEQQNERVQCFRTYYDSAVFLPQGAKS